MKLEKFKLDDMKGGWFIGNFEPSLLPTNDIEIAVKVYKMGDSELSHHHKIATEFTVILDGIVEMNNELFRQGDIIKIMPGVSTDFKALTEVKTVVVKIPGANNDKYID